MKLFDGNQRAGEIVSAVQSPMDGRWVGIAYIRADIARKGKVLSFDSGSVTIDLTFCCPRFAVPMQPNGYLASL